jgi:hypothetical protein
MAVSSPVVKNPPSARPVPLDWTAGALSYVVPGMGQISQGRISKGVFFFLSIYALFFYGMYLGSWMNVYLPDTADKTGQFWVGVAAWPAVWQYNFFKNNPKDPGPLIGKFQRQPDVDDLNALERNGDKTRDLGWVFTVIAGVLNIMVIYDAVAGPAYRASAHPSKETDAKPADAAAISGR